MQETLRRTSTLAHKDHEIVLQKNTLGRFVGLEYQYRLAAQTSFQLRASLKVFREGLPGLQRANILSRFGHDIRDGNGLILAIRGTGLA